jgi:protein-S-isoprenylcysteine O-methyltransferase Ste14
MAVAKINTSKLKRRIMLVFLVTIVMLGLFLFVPAGSLTFWQAWVYSIVSLVSSAAITFYILKKDPALLERRTKVGVVEEKEKGQKLVQGFAYIGFILLLIIPALDHRFGWSHVPFSIVILGDILVVSGLYIYVLVLKENTFASATIEITTDQKVISTGPYGIVRHPMYLGALIYLFGTPLALGSWWGLLLLIPYTLVLSWRLLDEEKFLSRNLQGYDEYRQKVRYRLIPLLW